MVVLGVGNVRMAIKIITFVSNWFKMVFLQGVFY